MMISAGARLCVEEWDDMSGRVYSLGDGLV